MSKATLFLVIINNKITYFNSHESKFSMHKFLLFNWPLPDSRLNFDPLSALELRLTDIIIREYRNATSQWQFKFIGVDESGTSRMHPHFQHPKDPTHVHRRVNVFLMDPAEGIPIWAVVNLSTLKVEGWIEGKLEEKEVEDELPDNVALFGNITPRHIYNMIFALVVVYTYRFFIFNYEEFGSMPTTGLHAVVAYYAWMHYIIVSSIVYYAALCFNRYYLPMFGN